ncbi:MAG: tetratricopeptide repeat protein [Dongiaceae bacterium]
MPIVLVSVVLLQIACAVHAVRSGRPHYWIFIIIVAPMLGCIVYFIVAILPDMAQSRTARHAQASLVKAVDPDRDLRILTDRFETADTIDNRRALAEEYLSRGEHGQAIMLYEGALIGPHRDDPILLQGLAAARFEGRQYSKALATLDRLRAANPDYRSANAHLLYARSLEGAGRDREALDEYLALTSYFPGAEAKCRMAMLLDRLGRAADARPVYQDIVRSLDRAGRPYRDGQREWYELARRHLG